MAGEALGGLVVEAEVEDCVHHAGHRDACSGAHGEQERVGGVAEASAGDRLGRFECATHGGVEGVGVGAAEGVVGVADLGGDGEARRDGDAEAAHLGQAGALAAEQLAHGGVAGGRVTAEAEDGGRLEGYSRRRVGCSRGHGVGLPPLAAREFHLCRNPGERAVETALAIGRSARCTDYTAAGLSPHRHGPKLSNRGAPSPCPEVRWSVSSRSGGATTPPVVRTGGRASPRTCPRSRRTRRRHAQRPRSRGSA